ncbi:SHOCT domain-containing protein [Streptomyces sp. NPDC004393]|uniref:SHOCT domain-containing protein n=1 Tax=unclassified Streptomyces TaxID=2593676 RepID=UPI0033A5B975
MMWYGGWGGWFFMAVITVAFWALLIVGILALVHYSHRTRPGQRPDAPSSGTGGFGWGTDRRAEDLLAERFARGEIDEDEYRRRLSVLREHR